MPAFTCRYTKAFTLAAGVPETIDIPIDGARDWKVIARNDGANDVDAGSAARSPLGTLFDDALAIPLANLPPAGLAMVIDGESEPLTTLRLVLSSTLGTTLTIEAGGW